MFPMAVTKMDQNGAHFFLVEKCECCELDHIIYERDMHSVINKNNNPEKEFAFVCPVQGLCVLVKEAAIILRCKQHQPQAGCVVFNDGEKCKNEPCTR